MDSEAERQGEILAFYGEEDARNYDSPEPGPLVEKDDTAMKSTEVDKHKVRLPAFWLSVLSFMYSVF